jgi:hypothetical protein
MSPRGGKREGAGKPAFFSKPMKRVNVMLDEDTIKFYTEQGKGNLSEGIRKHWRGLTPLAPDRLAALPSVANPLQASLLAEVSPDKE